MAKSTTRPKIAAKNAADKAPATPAKASTPAKRPQVADKPASQAAAPVATDVTDKEQATLNHDAVYNAAAAAVQGMHTSLEDAVKTIVAAHTLDPQIVRAEVMNRVNRPAPVAKVTPTKGHTLEHGIEAHLAKMKEIHPKHVESLVVTAPKAFKLTLDNGTVVPVQPGVQRMPRCMAEHWYAQAHGVTIFKD